jgi:hypothetical protein
MSFQTFITSVIHYFTNPSITTKLTELKAAVEHDYDTILAKAEADLKAGTQKVETIAHAELQAIRNATGSALRRAEALLGTGAITGSHGEVLEVLAKGLDGAANLIDPTIPVVASLSKSQPVVASLSKSQPVIVPGAK